jgi:hypothetical protein
MVRKSTSRTSGKYLAPFRKNFTLSKKTSKRYRKKSEVKNKRVEKNIWSRYKKRFVYTEIPRAPILTDSFLMEKYKRQESSLNSTGCSRTDAILANFTDFDTLGSMCPQFKFVN